MRSFEKPFTLNFRGHNNRGFKDLVSTDVKENDYSIERYAHTIHMLQFEESIRTDPTLAALSARPLLDLLLRKMGDCYVCGQPLMLEKLEGDERYQVNSDCKFPKGLPKTDLKLNVPSGKIVFTNDSRKLAALQEREDQQCMSTSMGLLQISQMYERGDMIHFLVGNSCPSIYKMPGNKLRVAVFGKGKGGRRVGSICTDLWWVCGMDHDWYMRRCKETGQTPEPEVVVPVKKGLWKFKFDPNRHCDFTHCDARWVR